MGCCATNDTVPDYYQPNKNMEPQSPAVVIVQTPIPTAPGVNMSPMGSGLKPAPTSNHPLYQGDLGEASKLFYFGEYSGAAEIYRNYIEGINEETVEDIDGFGQV